MPTSLPRKLAYALLPVVVLAAALLRTRDIAPAAGHASIKRDHVAVAVIGARSLRNLLIGGNLPHLPLRDGHRVGMARCPTNV